jgi:hypothetical protein
MSKLLTFQFWHQALPFIVIGVMLLDVVSGILSNRKPPPKQLDQ